MKKKIISISAISVGVIVAAALIAFGLLQLVRQKNVVETGNVLGIEWYDENETEFTISTAEEFLEFAQLSDFYNFEDQTVKLGADIIWNEGNAEEWAENPPANKWNSINKFAGTFDGQGHTISGIYMKGYESKTAMFINPEYKCTIQNFKLVNSYIETAGFSGSASIVAGGGCKIIGVYSNAIINHKGENVAGIASTITKQTTIEECQFDGVINITLRDCGGIVDEIDGGRVNIRHCLFSGVINSQNSFDGTRTGGIVGRVANAGAVIIQDSLSSGKVNAQRPTYTGGVVGVSYVGTQTTINDTYLSDATYGAVVGTANGTWTGNALALRASKLFGTNAYAWSTLDFDKYWSAVENGTPVLKRFDGEGLDLTGVAKAFDTSWYSSGLYNMEIKTLEQLYGFYYVSAGEKFTDKVVKLGADIVMNTGKASDWEKNPPANDWLAIPTFEGVFDGQGHTISGIYSKSGSTYQGLFGIAREASVIKNLSIKNSFFHNTNTSLSALGTIAGDSYGKVENIYSNAIIIGEGQQIGGIIGRQNDNDSNGKEDCMTISNCWFDGSVSLRGEKTMEAGGIVGRAVQGDLVMEHCLNTGTVSSEATGTGLHIGGLIGRGNSKTITVRDCLTTGKIICNYNVCVGAAFGRLPSKTTVVTIENVYTTNEAYKDVVGTSSPAQQIGGVVQLPESWFVGNNAYKYTELDFPNYWALVKNDTPILQSFATSDPSTKGLVKAVDTSWYNKDATEYIIKTPAQFFGFAFKSMQDTFKDKTVKLGANIDMSTLGVDWISIGTRTKVFKGTFDGQGYTISGVTQKSDAQDVGLFGSIDNTAVLKNFRLVDSTFEYYSEAANEKEVKVWVGSVCADMRGDLENIYSNATVISNGSRVGGIAGMPNGSKDSSGNLTTSTIKNCWFDGEVRLVGRYARYAGGIAGQSMQGTIEIIHCLNTGKISNERPDAGQFLGGIMGSEQNGNQTILIQDCVNIGEVSAQDEIWNCVGAIIGGTSTSSSTYNIINTYALNTSCVSPSGLKLATRYKGTLNNAAMALSKEELTGYEPFKWTELDTNHWVPIANGTPELKYFSTGMSMAGVEKMYDTSWYSTDKKEFTISTAKQLYGLAVLSGTNTFEGQTFKIGNDIDMSSYDRWVSIGNTAKAFKGTFDGQNHTISNMTQKTATPYAGLIGYTQGAVIKNVIVKDSTFESTSAGNAFIGGIVGGGNGKLLDSYSNATIVSTGVAVGGLIGRSTGYTISGCWYDGDITVDYTGADSAQVGGLLGTGATKQTTIDNCAFTGSVDVAFTATDKDQGNWGSRIGGIVGGDGKAPVIISNTLGTGDVNVTWKHNDSTGSTKPASVVRANSVIGWVQNANTATKDNVYTSSVVTTYVEDKNTTSSPTATYTKEMKESISFNAITMNENNLLGVEGYRYTELDFANYWAARKDEVPGIKKFVDSALNVANVIKPDTSWYDASKEEFHITDEAEFYGFTKLVSEGNSFSGKIVYLEADMELNEVEDGTIAAWKAGTEDPSNPWMMIGNPNAPFRGTFDGQMHTVSGLYTQNSGQYNGAFGYVLGATIKNLKIVDSYFESTPTLNSFMGGVAGGGNGKILNCYTSATMYSTGIIVGGIVGRSTGFTIDGCWFDGDMTVDYKGTESLNVGGILATCATTGSTITNCLVTGTMELSFTASNSEQGHWRGRVGSIAGADGKQVLTVNDCIAAGKLNLTWKHNEGSTKPASMEGMQDAIGYKENANSAASERVYLLMDSKILVEDSKQEYVMTSNTTEEALLGMNGFYNTVLDFTNYWAARDGKIPALKKFVPTSEQLDTPSDLMRFDTTWYDSSKTEYYIGTPEAMYGFMKLMNEGNVFSGKTIYLTADIAMNKVEEGTVDKWAAGTEVASNKWIPSGNDTGSTMFSGTFDGQGHTISGLYVNSDTWHGGLFGSVSLNGVVRDFSLVDSYIYAKGKDLSGTGYAYTGSVVGQLAGTMEDVYSNAVVASPAQRVGGLVGVANCRSEVEAAGKKVNITRCWFDGKVIMTTSNGKAGGGIAGMAMQRNAVNITDCLFTGTITSEIASGKEAWVGGFVGHENNKNARINITNCLSAGTIEVNDGVTHVGSLVGYGKNSGAVYTLTNVYATKECYKDTVYNVAATFTNKGTQVNLADIKGDKATSKLAGFDFDTVWKVREDNVPALRTILTAQTPKLTADTSWYDGDSTTYTLSTANELLGLSVIVNEQKNKLEGITIKLDANIVFNDANAALVNQWATGEKVPKDIWTPVGDATTGFQGTFDGQGHTISGLYVAENKVHSGFFGVAGKNSTIKNVRLVDSYMENKKDNVVVNFGSVVGWGSGKITNVYSNVTMKTTGRGVGGVLGCSGGATITDCWFDGTVSQTYYGDAVLNLGGILGYCESNTTTINSSLFSGSMTADFTSSNKDQGNYGARVGGIAGGDNGKVLKINSTVSAGNIQLNWWHNDTTGVTTPNTWDRSRSVVGWIQNKNTTTDGKVYSATVVNTYVEDKNATGTLSGAYKSNTTPTFTTTTKTIADLKASTTSELSLLTFSDTGWYKAEGKLPVPAALRDMLK